MKIDAEKLMVARLSRDLECVHSYDRGEFEAAGSLVHSVICTFYWAVGGNRTWQLFSPFCFSICGPRIGRHVGAYT